MVPARYSHILFGFILSGLMSCIVSGIATLRALGPADGILGAWMSSWATSWMVAFPTVLIVAPLARKLVGSLTKAP